MHYCHVFSVSPAQPSPAHLFDVSEHQYNGKLSLLNIGESLKNVSGTYERLLKCTWFLALIHSTWLFTLDPHTPAPRTAHNASLPPHPQPSGRLKCVGTTTALGTVNWVDISDRYIFWWIMARRHYSPCSRCDCPLSGQCSQVEDTNCTGNTPPPPLLPVLCTVQCTGQYCTGETSHAGTGRQ